MQKIKNNNVTGIWGTIKHLLRRTLVPHQVNQHLNI